MPYTPYDPYSGFAGGLLAGSQVALQYKHLKLQEEQQKWQREFSDFKEAADLALRAKGTAMEDAAYTNFESKAQNAGFLPVGYKLQRGDPNSKDFLQSTASGTKAVLEGKMTADDLHSLMLKSYTSDVNSGNKATQGLYEPELKKANTTIAEGMLGYPQTVGKPEERARLGSLVQNEPAYQTPEAVQGISGYLTSPNFKPGPEELKQASLLAPERVDKYNAEIDKQKPKETTAGMAADRYRTITAKLETAPETVTTDEKAFISAYEKEKAIGPTAYGESRKKAMLAQPKPVWDVVTKTKKMVTGQEALDNSDRYLAPTSPEAMEATPTNDMKVMQQSAPSVLNLAQKVLTRIDDKNLGPVKSRWREAWQGKVGTTDPNFAALKTDVSLLATRLMKMHVGSRGGAEMIQYFKSQLEVGKQSPENLRSVVNEIVDYANEVKSHRISPGGPNLKPETSNNDPLGIR